MRMTAALGLVALMTVPTLAQSDTQIRNAIVDSARAERSQAESLRRIERTQREQATRDAWDRNNAKRDARSLRRFD